MLKNGAKMLIMICRGSCYLTSNTLFFILIKCEVTTLFARPFPWLQEPWVLDSGSLQRDWWDKGWPKSFYNGTYLKKYISYFHLFSFHLQYNLIFF